MNFKLNFSSLKIILKQTHRFRRTMFTANFADYSELTFSFSPSFYFCIFPLFSLHSSLSTLLSRLFSPLLPSAHRTCPISSSFSILLAFPTARIASINNGPPRLFPAYRRIFIINYVNSRSSAVSRSSSIVCRSSAVCLRLPPTNPQSHPFNGLNGRTN